MARPVALVTGASRGIGRAIALELARNGFDLAINDISSGADLDAVAQTIIDSGARALPLSFDVSGIRAHDAALTRIAAELGPLTTLVNNAGVGVMRRGDPLEVSEVSFDRCMTVNAKALFFLCQAFARHLLARPNDAKNRRSIINVTSSNATAAAAPRSEYCASKAAAAMISKCFAVRLGSEGIAVYDVQPGLIETEMTAPVIDSYKQRAADGLCLFPWVGSPDDVAAVVATLATDRLPYTTGHVISVDGGMLLPRFLKGAAMKIALPDTQGHLFDYRLIGTPVDTVPMSPNSPRMVYSAAHVVRDPFAEADQSGQAAIDWDATLAFREHLIGLGLGVAEAMDTAQRGMGLDWPNALELIKRTKSCFPDALVANGCGTDHIDPVAARTLQDVTSAYLAQVEAVQSAGGRVILMASRALARVARGPEDYARVYADVLGACDEPVILHWLGEMFDPALAGYWGASDFPAALETVLDIINHNRAKVDGIKISLLDANKEVEMRRRLPKSVRMYTGDDFNYPDLIAGDDEGFSHALLGIFDPLAVHAANAVQKLANGDAKGFRDTLDPTVPLARHVFRAPTQFYKTGVVFLAWLNGHQSHFKMIGGAEAMRPLPYFVDCFKLADACGALARPDLAVDRMRSLLRLYGV